ncbi:MAG TPA: hypothetical protein VN815_00015 [Steroidobacteraceae bacterium]|nr:hypothetical protein [Steroidobacteraceae bacterium]
MGGQSSQQQTQSSQTAPWQPAQGALLDILGKTQGLTDGSGVTAGENSALNTIVGNSGATQQFNPAINASTSNLLGGGGALNQSPMLNAAYNQYRAQTNPLASNTNYDPMQTPGIGAQLAATNDAITQQINGQFAGAGRDMSGYNQKALAQGLAAGEAPILTNQYNTNVSNQQGAAGNLFNAGGQTAGALGGMQQNFNANQQAGVNQVGTGLNAQNSGAMSALAAELQRQGIPIQNLGLLAQIGVPIASLGQQSSGTSNTVNQASPTQQFAQLGQGFGSFGSGLFGNQGAVKGLFG